MPEIYVGAVDDFADDTRIAVSTGGREVVVFRYQDTFHAVENRCAHSGGPVGEGVLLGRVEAVMGPDGSCLGERFSTEQIHLVCPWHGWEYDLATGEFAGDRRVKLRRFDVVERDGSVFLDA